MGQWHVFSLGTMRVNLIALTQKSWLDTQKKINMLCSERSNTRKERAGWRE